MDCIDCLKILTRQVDDRAALEICENQKSLHLSFRGGDGWCSC